MPVEIVTSPGGVHAWLVQDHTLPVISLSFAFRGGVEQDPEDKQGLTALLADTMTEGAGKRDAAAFQQALADHGIGFGLNGERDVIGGAIRTLRADMQMAAALAHDALTAPRFDAEAVARVKAEHAAVIASRLADPEWQARRLLYEVIFPGHPYAMRSFGTAASNAAIAQDDLRAAHQRRFARDNLMVSVVGDVTPTECARWLDAIFAGLPAHADLRPVADIAAPDAGTAVHLAQNGGQSVLLFAARGIKRDDPDWYAASILNYVLGGGGFSSRLMDEVRDKRGLTYNIGTGLTPMDHAGIILGQALTANAKAGESWDLTRAVWEKVWRDGVTAEELAAAKSYLIGALPTSFTSTGAIAEILADMQQQRLPPDDIDRRVAALNAVTLDDVARAARRLLDPARLTLIAAGKPEGIKADREETFIEQ